MALTFNCSQAACDFFSRIHKGKKITAVQQAPPMQASGEVLHTDFDQWLVHAATVQRKHVLLAIHLKTRYCMLFFDMKKADAEGFVQSFINRWTIGVMDLLMKCGALDFVDPQIPQQLLKEHCQSFVMFPRGDRSAQTHINEVLRFFKWDAEDFDFVNQPWSALYYDARTNHTPRTIKGQKDYIFPDEEMLIHWLITVGSVPVPKAEQIREIYRRSLRAQVD